MCDTPIGVLSILKYSVRHGGVFLTENESGRCVAQNSLDLSEKAFQFLKRIAKGKMVFAKIQEKKATAKY